MSEVLFQSIMDNVRNPFEDGINANVPVLDDVMHYGYVCFIKRDFTVEEHALNFSST